MNVVKGIFGDKSAKDKKLIWPIVEEIYQFQDTLSSKSDDDLKQNNIDLYNELSNLIKDTKIKLESKKIDEDDIDEQLHQIEVDFLNDKLVEVFAIVKESAKRLMGTSFNLMGQAISTLSEGYKDAGSYTLTWDAANASSGMYFVQAEVNGFTQIQKLMFIK